MATEQTVYTTDLTRFNTPDIELRDLVPSREPASTQQLSQFLDFPLELRLEIFAYTIISPSTVSWQGSYIGDKGQHSEASHKYVCNGSNAYLPSRYNIAALLLASRALYADAAPVFYSKNSFRFRSPAPGLPLAFSSPTFTTNLRHLTIGIPTYGLSKRQLTCTDKVNSARVAEIAHLCPALRTFTTHVPRLFEPGVAVQPLPRVIPRRRKLVIVFSGVMLAVAVGLFICVVRLFTR